MVRFIVCWCCIDGIGDHHWWNFLFI